MKTKTETILKYLPQYDEIMQETNTPSSQATTYTTFCVGWLSGAKAAIDAILDAACGDTNIYGCDYGDLSDRIESTMTNWGFFKEKS